MINNVIYKDEAGEFDYLLEVGSVEIVEVFEDGISFINVCGEIVTEFCSFEGNAAVINS